MPPAPKRNRCVILYDLNTKIEKQLRQALIKVYSYNHFRSSNTLVNLVLVNSEKTDNRKHARCGKGYLHITEINKEPFTFDPLIISETEVKSSGNANWKEAICVAIQILQEDDTANIITHQILYLTDLSNLPSSDDGRVDIADDLRKLNIFLYIVGPYVKYPRSITSLEEIHTVMQNICFEKENDTLKNAKKLVDSGDKVVIADIKTGLQLFYNYVHPFGKQPWPVPLTFGTTLALPVGSSKLMERDQGLQLVSESGTHKLDYVFASKDDSTKIYNEDNIRKGITRHGKFIPLQSNEMFKIQNERTFSLMFITEIKSVPEYMMQGTTCFTVVADKTSSAERFNCLVSRLHERKLCIIAKRVYNKGNIEMFFALIPNPNKNVFRAVQLPYSHEVPFEWHEENVKKDENGVSEKVSNYLASLTINSSSSGINCLMTHNVVCTAADVPLLNIAASKLLNERLHLDEVTYDAFQTGLGPKIGKELRDIWPSEVLPKEEILEDVNDLDSDIEEDYF